MNSMASAPPRDGSPSVLILSAAEVGRRRLGILFEQNGFRVLQASAPPPLLLTGMLDVNLVVLDLATGDPDPLAAYRRMIAGGCPPTIVMSERSGVVDEIVVLELGADSLLAKPVDDRLLLARARALLRRVGATNSSSDALGGPAGSWRLSAGSPKAISPAGREVKLTAGEIAIFGHFLTHPGVTLTVEGAARAIGAEIIGRSGFRSALCRLRRKLVRVGEGDPIRNVRGVGYAYGALRPTAEAWTLSAPAPDGGPAPDALASPRCPHPGETAIRFPAGSPTATEPGESAAARISEDAA